MKRNLVYGLLFLFVGMQAQDFEGDIYLTTSGTGMEETEIVYTIQGPMVKITHEREGKKIEMISNRSTRIMTTVVDNNGQLMAIKQSMDQMNTGMTRFEDVAEEHREDVNIRKTGEKKKFGDIWAEKIEGESRDYKGYGWITQDLGVSLSDLIPNSAMAGGRSNEFERLYGKDGFVLEMESRHKVTDDVVLMKSRPVKRKVESSEFEIDPDAQVIDQTNLMQMIQDAGGDADKLKEIGEKMRQQYEQKN